MSRRRRGPGINVWRGQCGSIGSGKYQCQKWPGHEGQHSYRDRDFMYEWPREAERHFNQAAHCESYAERLGYRCMRSPGHEGDHLYVQGHYEHRWPATPQTVNVNIYQAERQESQGDINTATAKGPQGEDASGEAFTQINVSLGYTPTVDAVELALALATAWRTIAEDKQRETEELRQRVASLEHKQRTEALSKEWAERREQRETLEALSLTGKSFTVEFAPDPESWAALMLAFGIDEKPEPCGAKATIGSREFTCTLAREAHPNHKDMSYIRKDGTRAAAALWTSECLTTEACLLEQWHTGDHVDANGHSWAPGDNERRVGFEGPTCPAKAMWAERMPCTLPEHHIGLHKDKCGHEFTKEQEA